MSDEDINEKLAGLVTLLKAVGVSDSEVDKVSKSLGQADQLNDAEVGALITKLQSAQEVAPQIIAALETRAGKSVGSGKSKETAETSEHSSEDDENYPIVGHGYSDEISVMSDMTTPTVVDSEVNDEEHYREVLPPMMIGGHGTPAMQVAAPKRKNLVSQVRPSSRRASIAGSRPTVGGTNPAEKRRNKFEAYSSRAEHAVPSSSSRKKKSSKSSGGSVDGGRRSKSSSASVDGNERKKKSGSKKKAPPRTRSDEAAIEHNYFQGGDGNQWEAGGNWNAFESSGGDGFGSSKPRSKSKDDGFDFDPFASGDPFASSAPSNRRSKDLEFGVGSRDPYAGGEQSRRKKKPVQQSNFSGKKAQGASSNGRPRRTRRASLAM